MDKLLLMPCSPVYDLSSAMGQEVQSTTETTAKLHATSPGTETKDKHRVNIKKKMTQIKRCSPKLFVQQKDLHLDPACAQIYVHSKAIVESTPNGPH